MKKNNPQIPILIREAQGTIPKVYARYGTTHLLSFPQMSAFISARRVLQGLQQIPPSDIAIRARRIIVCLYANLIFFPTEFGNETAQSLEGLSDKQVEETVTGLVKKEAA